MGIISVEKANHLFWLGRYTERVFTTLRKFFRVYDSMIDTDELEAIYGMYCERLSIPNIYTSGSDFVERYLFDDTNPDSLYSNMIRAYDNAVVLRDELSSNVLAYIQLAMDIIKAGKHATAPLLHLQPVIDYLFAFWGCVDDYVTNEECRNIMKTGKYVERLDLYVRLNYHIKDTRKEYCKMVNRIYKGSLPYNKKKIERLGEILEMTDGWKTEYFETLDNLNGIVEVM